MEVLRVEPATTTRLQSFTTYSGRSGQGQGCRKHANAPSSGTWLKRATDHTQHNLVGSAPLHWTSNMRTLKWNPVQGLQFSTLVQHNDQRYCGCVTSVSEGSKSTSELELLQLAEGSTMEDVYKVLADRLVEAANACRPGQKHMVAVAGSPGSGKSTLAAEVCRRANQELQKEGTVEQVATAVPMDGFHLYRRELDAMPDPREAHARRGAPWTFNPKALVKCLSSIREQGYGELPSFDHGVGDPVEGDIHIRREQRVVVVEGNYLLLEDEHWSDLQGIFDERWFIECDLDVAMERVTKRHISTGKAPEVAKWRVDYNDRPNGELIKATFKYADLIIPSLPLGAVDLAVKASEE